MSRRFHRLVLVPAALTLALTACGGGEGESDEAKPYVEEISTSMSEDEDSPVSEKEAECWAKGFIDVVGIDRIKKAGSPEEFGSSSDDLNFQELDLTRDEGEEIYAKFGDCGVDMREEMMSSMAEDDELDETSKKCLEDALTDERLEDFFVTSMVEGEDGAEDSEAGKELVGALMGCMLANIPDDMGDDTTTE